jgi:hypothetical protein
MRKPKTSSDTTKLEKRVERLERDVRELRRAFGKGKKPDDRPWWQQIAGVFENDRAFAEIVRLGRKIRRAERK